MVILGIKGVIKLTEAQVYWFGLRDDREREIFVDAFWLGINPDNGVEKQVSELEANWRKAKDDSTTTV